MTAAERTSPGRFLYPVLWLGMITFTGCASLHEPGGTPVINEANIAAYRDVPRELHKTAHPLYRVAPPDVLLIQSVNAIRLPSAPLGAGDVLTITLGNPAPLFPQGVSVEDIPPIEAQYLAEMQARAKFINGDFTIQPDGTVDLGPVYGSVRVAGLTVEQAENAIRNHLTQYTRNPETGDLEGIVTPEISVTLPNLAGPQPIAGEHLIRPDGTISLGIYGAVSVAGMTLPEVRRAVETHLSRYLKNPRVAVDVLAYNSKFIYVITDGGGFGEQVIRVPVTGNETVLDAISKIQGLSEVSSKRIWVARPAPAGTGAAQVMDVHWKDITQGGMTATNYQLFAGDRIYIQADHLIATDNFLGKLLAPVERILGVTLLGSSTVRSIRNVGNSAGVRGGGGIGF